ncbi:MAG: EamA/RhaT family transporter [Elusimicrobia bacterium]|nr:EamA/RhaT family transporter [Elusimicrobiota bacterium]
MHYLILSIVCSVAVSILLKISKNKGISINQAVAVNYPVAAISAFVLFKPNFVDNYNVLLSEWQILLPLGVLLPSVFIIMGECVKQAGIAKSDAAQRLSLFLPILAAFLIFGENLSIGKILAVVLAIVSLTALVYKPKSKIQSTGSIWILLGVWLGYGIIDILFKQLSKNTAMTATNLCTVFVLSAIILFTYLIIRKIKWNKASIFGGIILGCLNFGNIYFYFRAHQVYNNNPTLIFAAMNLGVISFGTIIGTAVFKEKINVINIIGIVLAMAAIVCLFYTM